MEYSNVMDLFWVVVILLFIGGLYLGTKLVQAREKGKVRRTPLKLLDGIMLMDVPKTPNEKNIILGKVLVIFYMFLGVVISPYFYLMTILPVLYHIEYFK